MTSVKNNKIYFGMRAKDPAKREALKKLSWHINQIKQAERLSLQNFDSDVKKGVFKPIKDHIILNRFKNEVKDAEKRIREFKVPNGHRNDLNERIARLNLEVARDFFNFAICPIRAAQKPEPIPPILKKVFDFTMKVANKLL